MVVGIAATVKFVSGTCLLFFIYFRREVVRGEGGRSTCLDSSTPLDPLLIKEYFVRLAICVSIVVIRIAAAMEFVACFCAFWDLLV